MQTDKIIFEPHCNSANHTIHLLLTVCRIRLR